MNVLLFNGSPRADGCTFTGLSVIKEQLAANGVDSEIIQAGREPIRGCIACQACGKLGKCAFGDGDGVNVFAEKLKAADGLVIGSAVHYASATGSVTSFFDRLFYSAGSSFKFKFGACVVSCRRGGATATFDQLNKYFTIAQMPVVPSCYWNQIHGNTPEEVKQDAEGLRTLKVLANNMAYLIKCKYAAEAAGITPMAEPPAAWTNFIR